MEQKLAHFNNQLEQINAKIYDTENNKKNEIDQINENIESIKQKIAENKEWLQKKKDEIIFRKNKIESDVNHSLTKINGGKQLYFPIITISNKTGFYIDVTQNIIKTLPPRQLWIPIDEKYISSNKIVNHFVQILKSKNMDHLITYPKPLEGNIFYIDSCFAPPGIGLVITGINRGSDIELGNTMYIGPINNSFVEFRVKGMHNNIKQNTSVIKNHWRAAINMALNKKGDIKRNQIKKGMIAVSSQTVTKNICYSCEAIMTFYSKSITIKSGYSPVIHMGSIRQTVKMTIDPAKNNGLEIIGFTGKTDSCAFVTMKFLINPEYVEPYSIFLIRNGDIHGIGMVLSTIPLDQDPNAKPDFQSKIKRKK
jgi:GTPase